MPPQASNTTGAAPVRTGAGARTGVQLARPLGLAAVVGAIVCFSISSAIVKWAQTPGAAIALWRMILAIPVWWAVMWVQRRRGVLEWPTAATWRRVLPAAMFFGANIATFFTVLNKTSIAHAEFIGALSPLLLLPAGALLFHEQPNWSALRWGAISVVGVAIVLFVGGGKGVATVQGDLLMLVVMGLWVGYLLATKWARGSAGGGGIDVVHFMACVMSMAVLATAPIALVVARDAIWPLSARAWIAVGLLTVITGVAAHGLIVFAQRLVPVATIGVMQVGQPALAVLWGWLILGETIVAGQVPGMILVVVGLTLFTLSSQRRVAPPTPSTPLPAN